MAGKNMAASIIINKKHPLFLEKRFSKSAAYCHQRVIFHLSVGIIFKTDNDILLCKQKSYEKVSGSFD
jgi:hypothetical protein